ncbi:MAG: protease modulator HflK, partial [bacterium]
VFATAKGEKKWQDRITVSLIAACFEKSTWDQVYAWIAAHLNLQRLPRRVAKSAKTSALLLMVFLGAVILVANCCFVVGPSQQAIRERMGKPLNWGRPLEPGLHLKLPWPFERAIKIDSRTIRSMNIGNIPSPRITALLWTVRHGEENGFLSGDNEYFCPYLVLHYRIKNVFDYAYRYERPEEILDHNATRLICDVSCGKGFYDIVTGYRGIMEEGIKTKLQEEMDALKTGLEIISVNARDIHPPVSIADSFEQVVAAIQDKDKMINQAIGYRNDSIPMARGEAVQSISQAQAYVDKCINRASGEASSFTNKYSAFRKNRSTASKRIYLQTMAEALADKKLILIDPASGIPEIWTRLGNMPPSEGEW